MTGERAGDHGFNPLVMAAMVLVGVIAFIALWALVALGPQLSSGNDGGGHALSKAAPGYAAIVDLLERAGADVELRRRVGTGSYDKTLLILTPALNSKPADIEELGEEVRRRVKAQSGVELEWEIQRVGVAK